MNLFWLGDPRSFNPNLVGGKAAHLSRLARLNHRVPDGFCLPVTVEKAQPLTLLAEIDQAISDLMACHHLTDLAVAVRSSAIDEDGTNSSFAGQYDSYLNVVGAKAILQAVRQCWQSVGTERAQAYRRQRGLSAVKEQMGVLVQQMVMADVTGVLFSANPITEKRGEVVINASWGMGPSIVGGTVMLDTFIVRKSDLAVVGQVIAVKARMTVAVPGGTREVDVPHFLQRKACLSAGQLVEMARLALGLEGVMGYPVDIECAYSQQDLFLLQCRPATGEAIGKA